MKYFLTCLFLYSTYFAAERDFNGIVINSETNEKIPYAVVKILELSQTLTCDVNGEFNFNEIQYGTYTFVINHIGYKENISTVILDEFTNKLYAFYLIPRNIELDAVIISDYKSFSKFD